MKYISQIIGNLIRAVWSCLRLFVNIGNRSLPPIITRFVTYDYNAVRVEQNFKAIIETGQDGNGPTVFLWLWIARERSSVHRSDV
ncbi:MAG: hypothetical protein ABW185_25400 [Sedimenticola sp.]